MNILGQSFEDWVTQQVNVRQKSLGKGSGGSAADIQYQQTKTPWVRLASSIDIDGKALKNITNLNGFNNNNVKGQNLAKNFILQGGALTSPGSGIPGEGEGITQRSGLALNGPFTGVYGWGGTTLFQCLVLQMLL